MPLLVSAVLAVVNAAAARVGSEVKVARRVRVARKVRVARRVKAVRARVVRAKVGRTEEIEPGQPGVMVEAAAVVPKVVTLLCP